MGRVLSGCLLTRHGVPKYIYHFFPHFIVEPKAIQSCFQLSYTFCENWTIFMSSVWRLPEIKGFMISGRWSLNSECWWTSHNYLMINFKETLKSWNWNTTIRNSFTWKLLNPGQMIFFAVCFSDYQVVIKRSAQISHQGGVWESRIFAWPTISHIDL